MGLTPRSRILLLARTYARTWPPSQGRRLHRGIPGWQKAGANSKGGCNRETLSFRSSIENKLAEHDQKLVRMEGEMDAFEGRITAEEELSKLKEQKDAKALKCAMHEVEFSILKGAGAFVGLTAAVGSVVANMSRITAWFSGGKGSDGSIV